MGTMTFTTDVHTEPLGHRVLSEYPASSLEAGAAVTEQGGQAGGKDWWRRRGTREEIPLSLSHELSAAQLLFLVLMWVGATLWVCLLVLHPSPGPITFLLRALLGSQRT